MNRPARTLLRCSGLPTSLLVFCGLLISPVWTVSADSQSAYAQFVQSPEIQDYFRELRVLMLERDRVFSGRMRETGAYQSLEPASIRQDADFTRARASLKLARQVIAEEERILLEECITLINRKIPEKGRADFVRGFKNGLSEARQNGRSQFLLYEQIVDAFERAIDLLAASGKKWVIEEDEIVFRDAWSRRAYRKQLDSIDSLFQAASDLQQQSFSKLDRMLE